MRNAHEERVRRSSIDADLAAVVRAWLSLPESVRAGIVVMVKAAS